MTNNTQGHLKAFNNYAEPELRDEDDKLFAVLQGRTAADARRLVACWNACQGISTEVLEREQYLQTASYSLRHAAETQIVELLAALERLVRFIEIEDAHLANFGEVESARTAIARVKGGSGPTNITTHALELAAQAIASFKGGA